MISWDDYRLVLEIARARGLPGAAEKLGVTLATVFRRLERVEDKLGTRLFDRMRGSYEPTETGFELARAAEQMEHEAFSADRIISGRDQQLTGLLRVTTTDALAVSFLARHIPSFHNIHPGIKVEVISDDRVLSLAGRDADIALRPTRPTEETLVARKTAIIRWGIYASKGACESIGIVNDFDDLAGQKFVNWEGGPTSAWLDETIPGTRSPVISSSHITNAALAAASNLLVALPCMMGSLWSELGTVLAPLPEPVGELWVATHQDMRRNARVKALFDFLVAAAETEKALFEGEE